MAQYARGTPRTRWILDEHNIEFRITQTAAAATNDASGLYRVYAGREWRRRQREEIAAWRSMDLVMTTSEDDRRTVNSFAPNVMTRVIPNGVDVAYYSPSAVDSARATAALVFVGDMRYRPNSDAIIWFCRQIWPKVLRELPDATLTVVGRKDSSVRPIEGTKNVHFTGWVVDTRPYLRSSALAVVPLRAGSGTRLKVLESLAMGIPVLSTPKGYEGLEVTPGKHLVSAEGADRFASAILQVLRDPERYRAVGLAGRRLVESRYSWNTITRTLEHAYEAIGAGDPRSIVV
jgi:glycosyltransferase involved in cell wall biosynthesis